MAKIALIETNTVVLNPKNTIENQLEKIKEELAEVELELVKEKQNRTDLLQECFDLKQAVETLIFKLIDVKEFETFENAHIVKMQNKYDVSDDDLKFLCKKHGTQMDEEIRHINEDEYEVMDRHCYECMKEEFEKNGGEK